MEDYIIYEVLKALLVIVAVSVIIVSIVSGLDSLYKKSLEFKIIYSEGAYDIMLGNRRLTTKPTFEEAKQWLDEHKEDYKKKDKVVYKEKFYDKRRSN